MGYHNTMQTTPPPYSPIPIGDNPYPRTRRRRVTLEEERSPVIRVQEYSHVSRHMQLNLGPHIYGTSVPTYGLRGAVQGFVQLDKFDHVECITVMVKGVASTTLSHNGVPTTNNEGRTLRTVLCLSTTIYQGSESSSPSPNTRIPFSIPLPSFIEGTTIPLPPTFIVNRPRYSGYIRYFVKADVTRKGWRPHESLGSTILYFPKSTPPPPDYSLAQASLPQPNSLGIDSSRWKISPFIITADVQAEFALPFPLAYAAQRCIPFIVGLYSSSTTPISLSIYLVRFVIISIGQQRNIVETILASGNVWDEREEQSDDWRMRIIKGDLLGGREEGEASWIVPGLLETKYAVRVRFEETPGQFFAHDEDVVITTSDRDEDDLSLPALGLAHYRSSGDNPAGLSRIVTR